MHHVEGDADRLCFAEDHDGQHEIAVFQHVNDVFDLAVFSCGQQFADIFFEFVRDGILFDFAVFVCDLVNQLAFADVQRADHQASFSQLFRSGRIFTDVTVLDNPFAFIFGFADHSVRIQGFQFRKLEQGGNLFFHSVRQGSRCCAQQAKNHNNRNKLFHAVNLLYIFGYSTRF